METTVLRRAATWHRPLMILVAAMALLTVVTGVAAFADDRVLLGAPIWLKPFKFAVSILVYGGTLAWMLSLLPRGSRAARWSASVIAVSLLVEIVIIVAQVIRGTTSHYNRTTPLNETLWDLMATAIMVLFVAHIVIGVTILRARIAGRVARTGIVLGMLLSMIGLLAAVPMVVDADGAHTVGAADGGPGLPVTGWSTVAGDLRIGHFIGLHGLQALPLLAWALTRWSDRLAERTKVRLLLVAGAAYAGLTALSTWQALRGQPVTRPDAVTLTALAVLVAVTGVATALALRSNRRADLELAA